MIFNFRILTLVFTLLILSCSNNKDKETDSSAYPKPQINFDFSSLEKIIFKDSQNNHFIDSVISVYELRRADSTFQLYRTEVRYEGFNKNFLDTNNLESSNEQLYIKDIDTTQINFLIENLYAEDYDTLNLGMFDSVLQNISENARELSYSRDEIQDLESKYQEYFIEQLHNKEKLKSLIPSCIYITYTSDYPEFSIKFINKTDTLNLYSKNQCPYMIPWRIDSIKYNYSIHISKFFASLLSDNYSNKYRLDADMYLTQMILENAFEEYCQSRIDLDKLEVLLKDEFNILNEYFDISDLFIGMMSSLDWDLDSDGNSWSATLTRKNGDKQVVFSVSIAENENFSGSIKPFINKKDKIFDQVDDIDFLKELLKENPRYKIDIHFTKDKSFSDYAQRSFKRDFPWIINHNLDEIILFTLHQGSRWSRWLIFPDGKVLLWHFHGDSPLKNYTKEELKIPGGTFTNSCKYFDNDGDLIE